MSPSISTRANTSLRAAQAIRTRAIRQIARRRKRYSDTYLYGGKDAAMNHVTPDFSLQVESVTGACPVGEAYAKQNIAEKKIPVFSCEGPCIRGEIARLAANSVAQDVPGFARCCHAETFLVPHSSMARWVQESDKAIMIDGCFLKCHGRVLKKLIGEERMIHIDALPLYKKYNDIFLMDDVPEEERKAVARQVADKILVMLRNEQRGDQEILGLR